MRYVVMNTKTEETTTHGTWGAAFRAAKKQAVAESPIVIIERDADGERTYDLDGNVIDRQ